MSDPSKATSDIVTLMFNKGSSFMPCLPISVKTFLKNWHTVYSCCPFSNNYSKVTYINMPMLS